MKKVITAENGCTIEITGNCQWVEIEYRDNPENEDDTITGFMYKGEFHNLDDFIRIHNNPWANNPPEWLKEFHGYDQQGFGFGLVIKLNDSGEAVQVFRYS